ncbi:hypothetical protein AB837_00290 [bacterium AB1]|nr:hypothetical protein AB837_00290 [bacterium AB1]
MDNLFVQIIIFKALNNVCNTNQKIDFIHIPLCYEQSGKKISKSNLEKDYSIDSLKSNYILVTSCLYYLIFNGTKITEKLLSSPEQFICFKSIPQANKKISIQELKEINNKILKYIDINTLIQELARFSIIAYDTFVLKIKNYVKTIDELIQCCIFFILFTFNIIKIHLGDQYNYNTLNINLNINTGKEFIYFFGYNKFK